MVDSTATDSKPAMQPYKARSPDGWGILNARLPILHSVAQLLLVTLLGTFAKCSVDDYTHTMERTKRVDELTTALSTQDTDQGITKRNLALVTLDRLYSNPKPGGWQGLFSANDHPADDSLVFNIAEEVYRAGIATKPGVDKTLFLTRLNLARRIMCRRDPKRGKAFLKTVYQSTTALSSADADTLAIQPSNGIPIAPENRTVVQAITAGNVPVVETDPEQNKFCYIQFRTFTRATAQKLQQQLKDKKWDVPGVQRIAGNYGCTVRYYFQEDFEKAQKVQQITQAFLNTLQLPNRPTVRLLSLTKKEFAGVRAGQIEVWISSE